MAVGATTGRIGAGTWDIARRAHCRTNGASTDILARVTSLRRPRSRARSEIAETVRRDGCAVLPFALDAATVEELRAATLARPGLAKGDGGQLTRARMDLDAPIAPVYYYDAASIGDLRSYERVVCDPRIMEIAGAYLGVEPVLSTCQAWWSVPFPGGPSGLNAQQWHFDLSHPAWIKVFVYLTDVTEESGPHCVILGSHRRDPEGQRLRASLNRRSDEEIAAAYPGRELRITGPAGTMFAVDTRAWHKGAPPRSDPRLMMETYWTNCQVGPFPYEESIRRRSAGAT